MESWSRPCFKGFERVIIGDSSIRAFGRMRRFLHGMSITGFGGMDVLELICLLQAGKISNDVDLGKHRVRSRFQNGRDEFPTVRFCIHCYSECLQEFTGQLTLVIGLNNSLKAEREPFANEYGRNLQDVDGMFSLLDRILLKMLPNANVNYMPVLNVTRPVWIRSQLSQKIYGDVNANIYRRNHLQLDIDEPKREGIYDSEGIHILDEEALDFWTKAFTELQSTQVNS